MTEWQLQDAKNRFSAVVDAALSGTPQHVTRRGIVPCIPPGRPAVVVLAVDEYERLCGLDDTSAPTLARLLLDIPQDDEAFERMPLPPRQQEL